MVRADLRVDMCTDFCLSERARFPVGVPSIGRFDFVSVCVNGVRIFLRWCSISREGGMRSVLVVTVGGTA